eukprot:scaffold896_cov172-Amphora_coffeaeformis.AAC.12
MLILKYYCKALNGLSWRSHDAIIRSVGFSFTSFTVIHTRHWYGTAKKVNSVYGSGQGSGI